MKDCILAERLYVPEEYVTERILKEFTYFLGEDDTSDYSGVEGYVETPRSFKSAIITQRQINTYVKVESEGQIYYGFARGNLPKLIDMFGDYEWDNRMASPPFQYPVEFLPDKRLLTFERDGRGQAEAVGDWLDYRYGILRGAPRFGKTISAIFIAAALGKKTVIIAHQIELLQQFYKSVLEFTNVWDLRQQYGVVKNSFSALTADDMVKAKMPRDARGVVAGFFNDHKNPEELDICLLSWQKFASTYGPERIKDFQNNWGTVIVDECHRSNSLKFASVVNQLNAEYRMGLTGTVERKDGLEFISKEIIGPVTAEGRVRQVPCKVQIFQTGITFKTTPMEPLAKVYRRIYNCAERTNMIVEKICQDAESGYYICVAFHPQSVEQLQDMVARINFNLGGGKVVAGFWGAAPNRKELMKKVVDGKIHVLVANGQMLTGIDVPRWNMFYNIFPESNVVFNEEGKLSGNYYQKFSRIRTPYTYSDGTPKAYGIIKDFVDDGGFGRGSFGHRLKAYKNQGFDMEFFNLKKKGEKDGL